jgi:CubicO group peptidase (beta-lactamase class C family)
MRTVLYSALLPLLLINARADKLDSFVETLIERRSIAGLSLAVIQEGQIVKAAAYGLADKQSKTPVTTK